MTRTSARAFALGVHLIAVAACGSSSSPAPAPTPVVVAPQIGGTWNGSASDSSGPGAMTWTLTQSGFGVAGPVSVSTPLKTVVMTGALTGTLSSSTLTWQIAVPAGGVSGQPACTVTVQGSATLSSDQTTLNGTYSGSGSCTAPFSGGSITLTRQ